MSTVPTQQVTLSADFVRELETKARAMGLGLEAYLRFLTRVQERKHDSAFLDAAKYAFSKYPNALRKLAQ